MPGLTELLSIEEPEDHPDQQQHSFVKRSRQGQETEGAPPSKRLGDTAVADHDLDGADCPSDESACLPLLNRGRHPPLKLAGYRPGEVRTMRVNVRTADAPKESLASIVIP
jgi:hypothetical protein